MAEQKASTSPCQSCGACCSYFRVAFYWREAEIAENSAPVPISLVEDVSPLQRCMKGTNQKHHQRCQALSGKVGEAVGCTIYSNRPTPCRRFEASFENGVRNPRCDEARQAHGLKPLMGENFISCPQSPSPGQLSPDA